MWRIFDLQSLKCTKLYFILMLNFCCTHQWMYLAGCWCSMKSINTAACILFKFLFIAEPEYNGHLEHEYNNTTYNEEMAASAGGGSGKIISWTNDRMNGSFDQDILLNKALPKLCIVIIWTLKNAQGFDKRTGGLFLRPSLPVPLNNGWDYPHHCRSNCQVK